jgi:hypothetical protein
MIFDKKDSVSMAYASLIVTFSIILVILYLFNPSWIQIINKNTGKTRICWKLLLSYSVTFALILAIVVLIIVSNYRVESKQKEYTVPFSEYTSIQNFIK